MVEFLDPFGELADQHVTQMSRAEALPGAVNAGQRHLRGLGGIPGIHRLQAVIACAAVARMFFAEIAQHGLVTASGGFAVAEQGVQFLPFQRLRSSEASPPSIIWRIDTTSPRRRPARRRRQVVAPGAAGFLIVAFHALGQVEMRDEAYVGLSMPMPNATVATITTPSSRRKRL